MSHSFQREPHGEPQWRSLRTLERFISAAVWIFCAAFVWAGIRAWFAGAGVAMMIIALALCALAALALPHVKHALFRHVMADDADIDDEWRRFNRRG